MMREQTSALEGTGIDGTVPNHCVSSHAKKLRWEEERRERSSRKRK